MEKDIAIEVQNLSIGFQNSKQFIELISNINFKIRRGELIAIVGANGTGKSTLLKTLSKEISFKGKVKVLGELLETLSDKEFSKKLTSVGTAYQVQSYTTVFDVISKGRSVHTDWVGRFGLQDIEIINLSASKVGISHLLERYYNQLSDGEKQRTLLAMALAQQSDIILLDEPTAFIDYPNKYYLSSLLNQITKTEDKTVIFSSHDLEVVLTYADKILFFSDSKVELLSKQQFLQRDKIDALFDGHQLDMDFRSNLVEQLLNNYKIDN